MEDMVTWLAASALRHRALWSLTANAILIPMRLTHRDPLHLPARAFDCWAVWLEALTPQERELTLNGPRKWATAVYQFFDADHALLYVGVSRSLADRWDYHRCRTAWYSQAKWVALSFYPERHLAFRAENGVIVRDNPQFNVIRPNPRRGRWNTANPLDAPPAVAFPADA